MREYRTPGSVRGAPGNRCPYLDGVHVRVSVVRGRWSPLSAFTFLLFRPEHSTFYTLHSALCTETPHPASAQQVVTLIRRAHRPSGD